MTIVKDDVTGWATSDGEPRWRSTTAALERLAGTEVRWLTGQSRREVHVLHVRDGRSVCVLRRHGPSRRWSVNVEGFEFWHHVRLMGREMWAGPVGFDRIVDARRFAVAVMTQAGATVVDEFSPGTRLTEASIGDASTTRKGHDMADHDGTERHEYSVTWQVDVIASSPEEAARKARAMQLDTDSIADVFDVLRRGDQPKSATTVDISLLEGRDVE